MRDGFKQRLDLVWDFFYSSVYLEQLVRKQHHLYKRQKETKLCWFGATLADQIFLLSFQFYEAGG